MRRRRMRPTFKEATVVEFTQILCPVDLSELSMRPLRYATAFARWYDARLTALHVVPTFEPMQIRAGTLGDPVQIVQPVPQEDVLQELRRALDLAGASTLDPTVVAEAGDAAEVILDRAVAMPADLLVMGTHGRSGLNRLLLGSLTETVLHRAPCPVLTVPPHAPASAPSDVAFRHILCAMDFSPAALQAFGFAMELAREADGSVTLIQAIEWLAEEEPRELAHFNVAEYRQILISDAHERMQTLIADESGTYRNVRHVIEVGRAYREILRVASEIPADLIVMGAHGRGGPGLTPFGSTTHQVVRAATCPVLTVRTS